jgi:integrase
MSATKRESWGSLRKLPSGRFQARYPAPDGKTYPARTEDDKPLTFTTKTDAREWLSSMHTKIARGQWEPPAATAKRRRAEAAADQAKAIGFPAYAEKWLQKIRTEPGRSGRKRAAGTIRTYKSKIDGYLVPEFGDSLVREINDEAIRTLITRLDSIPSALNTKAEYNGVTRPVIVVLMMILRQAMRDGIITEMPDINVPGQKSVRHDPDHDPGDDIVEPHQVEALYEATPEPWRIMVLLAAWCQLRRGEALGLQRRDIEWHEDGTATLHVRRQMNANTRDYSDPKSDAGKRSMSVPKIMLERLKEHLRNNVDEARKAVVVPGVVKGTAPLSSTTWYGAWAEARDSVPNIPERFRYHDLRHTGLTIFAQEGATLAELMRRGGHSDIKVVLRYQHATMERDRELADKMSERAEARIQASRKRQAAKD